MSVTVLTAASTRRLTTIEALQLDLGDAGFGGDLLLWQTLIDAASRGVESACGTIFAQQTYQEIVPMQDDPLLGLSYGPIVAVTEVLFDTTAVTDYRVHSAVGAMLYRRTGWYDTWSAAPDVTVTYTAGYLLPDQVTPPEPTGPALPPDLERAVLESVKVWHHEIAPAQRVASKTLGLTGDRIDFGVQAQRRALPVLAQQLLQGYTRMRVA